MLPRSGAYWLRGDARPRVRIGHCVFRDPTASEVQVTVRYSVGAVDDGATPGIAHLVEHVMFQQVVDGQPAFTQLEDIAPYFNAGTTFDETTYVARAPAAALDKLLAIEASRLGDPCKTLDDSMFTREREVVANEVQQRDQTSKIYSALHRALYPEGHPYRRPIGGSVESLRAITRQQACAFADAHYVPQNAVLVMLPKLVDNEIKGVVALIELGDHYAPMLGIAVLPGEGETLAQAIEGTRRGVAGLPNVFEATDRDNVDDIVFDHIKQSAIYGLYSILEDGSDRDARLARYVAAGRDPREAIDIELRSLGELSRGEAADIAAKYLASNTPSVVTLKASAGKKRGDKVKLRAPIHDLGRRRTPVDPALANRPAAAAQPAEGLRAQTRTLPNGLKVVLLPVTAVPTFDARLIFTAGTADEPQDQRGVALLAAHTLTWDLHYLHDAFTFLRAGAMRNTDVGSDSTTFSVHARRCSARGTPTLRVASFVTRTRRSHSTRRRAFATFTIPPTMPRS